METYNYTASWVAEWFNGWPRVLISQGFADVNTSSTFIPDSYDYLEAITLWAAVPIAWLFLSFMFYLIYFCCWCCCCKNPKGKEKIPCHKCMLVCCTLLCLGAIAVGLYGNQVIAKGVEKFAVATEEANSTLDDIETKVEIIDRTLSDDMTQEVEDLQAVFKQPGSNATVQKKLQDLTKDMMTKIENAADSIINVQNELEDVTLDLSILSVDTYEFYRWLTTIIVLCWEALVCIMVFIGVGKTSRCLLFLAAVLGLITLIICWTTLGAEIFLVLGLSDFCMEPDTYILSQKAVMPVDEEIMEYYLYCYPSSYHPFEDFLEQCQVSLDEAQANLKRVEKLASDDYPKAMSVVHVIDRGLNQTEIALHDLQTFVNCDVIHEEYLQALTGVCHDILHGLTLLLLCTLVGGLMFTVLVLVGSCAWRKLVNKKDYYKVDKTDPYFPKPQDDSAPYLENYYSNNTTMPAILRSPEPQDAAEINSLSTGRDSMEITSHTRPNNDITARTNRYHDAPAQPNGEHTLPLIRGSPPPAYHPVQSEQYRQYDENPSLS
ncbi:protein tweety homolog 2-like isoform X2 [Ptychodera flava]|uniref:protein tweety homolog 2-like isoform X2 n=1 Tax=Ptychodera flava TaxID=63121 RepID=UPI00396A0A60